METYEKVPILNTIVRCIKIISGQGITIRFPHDNARCEYYERCCQCGAIHKVEVYFDYSGKTVDLIFRKLDKIPEHN